MLTTYSDANKVTSQGSVVQYSVVPEMATVNGETVAVWYTLTRTRTETFAYVGMTRDAAEQAAAEIRRSLTRKYAQWTAELADTEGATQAVVTIIPVNVYQCTSQVYAEPMGGEMWQVSVSIQDTDVIISLNEPADETEIEQYFQEAANRDTPTGTSKIMISAAKWNSATNQVSVSYSTLHIDNFDKANVTAEKWDGSAWVDASATGKTNTSLKFASSANVKFRISYGGTIHSDPFTTHDKTISTVTIVSATCKIGSSSSGASGWEYNAVITAEIISPDVQPSALKLYVSYLGGSADHVCDVIETDRSGNRYMIRASVPATSVPSTISFGLASKSSETSSVYCAPFTLPDVPYITPSSIDVQIAANTFSIVFASNQSLADLRQNAKVTVYDKMNGNAAYSVTPNSIVANGSNFTLVGNLPSALVASGGRCSIAASIFIAAHDGIAAIVSPAIYAAWTRPIHETTTFKFSGISDLTFHGTITPQTDTTFDVDWGDGNVTTGCTSSTLLYHNYIESGDYEVKVIGNILSMSGSSLHQMFDSANDKLSEISFANTITSLGSVAGIFAHSPDSGMSALTKVVGYGITSIPDNAFKNHLSLSTITLPSLSSCGADAFAKVDGVTCTVDFSGDTYFHFQGKANWSFGIKPLSTIKFSDQTITLAE